MNLTLFASLWMFGALSTACAQSQEAPPPPQEEERRERIERLEVEIRDMERAMKDAPPERQEELKKRILEKVAQLKEMRGGRPPQDPRHEKARRLEMEIRELQRELEKKGTSPENRKHLTARLDEAHARLRELQEQGQREDPFIARKLVGFITAVSDENDLVVLSVGRDAGVMEGDEGTLHRGEAFVGKLVIDRVDRAWSSGRLVLRGKESPRIGDRATMNAQRRPGQDPHGREPHPVDPELQKIHHQAMELERESMKLSTKMRGLPSDSPERTQLGATLKEVVTRLFDLREQARAREVDLIKKRLEELTQLLAKRKANRDAIIEKRIKQLSGENDELDW